MKRQHQQHTYQGGGEREREKNENNGNTTRAKYTGVSFHDVPNTGIRTLCFSLHFVSSEAFSGIVTL